MYFFVFRSATFEHSFVLHDSTVHMNKFKLAMCAALSNQVRTLLMGRFRTQGFDTAVSELTELPVTHFWV